MHVEQAKRDRQSLPTRGLKGNTQIWMNEKKERDAELWGCDTSQYWIIENKRYDLKDYIERHPGGRNWLAMTQGQDVTDLFIVHHLNEAKARAILAKYYIGETKNQVSRYSFKEDGLYRTVKREMLEEMTVEEIQSETKSKNNAFLLFAFLILFLGLTTYSIDENK